MPTTRVLIAVKTYPTLSEKYDELVCTAGFLDKNISYSFSQIKL